METFAIGTLLVLGTYLLMLIAFFVVAIPSMFPEWFRIGVALAVIFLWITGMSKGKFDFISIESIIFGIWILAASREFQKIEDESRKSNLPK